MIWTYKGVVVYRAGLNSSGIRWYALAPYGDAVFLRAGDKDSMRMLITQMWEKEKR